MKEEIEHATSWWTSQLEKSGMNSHALEAFKKVCVLYVVAVCAYVLCIFVCFVCFMCFVCLDDSTELCYIYVLFVEYDSYNGREIYRPLVFAHTHMHPLKNTHTQSPHTITQDMHVITNTHNSHTHTQGMRMTLSEGVRIGLHSK